MEPQLKKQMIRNKKLPHLQQVLAKNLNLTQFPFNSASQFLEQCAM